MHEVVSRILESGELWIVSSSAVAFLVNGPSPDNLREAMAVDILESSEPEEYARLKLIMVVFHRSGLGPY